jgi:hypothetical protein
MYKQFEEKYTNHRKMSFNKLSSIKHKPLRIELWRKYLTITDMKKRQQNYIFQQL